MAGSQDDEVVGESKETSAEASKEPTSLAVSDVADAAAPPKVAQAEPQAAEDEEDEEGGDEEDGDEEEDEAPPPPRFEEPAPLFSQHPWAVMARVLALSSLLGLSLSSWAQLSIKGSWVADFLMNNTRGVPERKFMLVLLVVGMALGGGVGLALLTRFRKLEREAEVERWLWFLFPAVLLPCLPTLFRAKPWQNRHEALLPIVILMSLLLEALLGLSLRNIPAAAREFWAQSVEQVPAAIKRRGPLVIVCVAALAYSAFFSFFLLRWHYKLRTGNFDLSINNNLMYGGLYGDFLKSPVAFPDDPGKYLAAHAKFGHYFFLPIYALVPRPETLLVIQSALIGAGSIPFFLFARRHVTEWTAAVLALVYLAYYPMHGATFSEFQNVPIAALFVFGVVWAADAKRWVWMGVFTAMACLMREDVPIGLSIIGAFLVASGYRPLPGLVLAAVSTSYFLFLRFYVMDEAGDWWFPTMYKELWADGERGFRSVIKTLLTNPLFVIGKVVIEKKILYLAHLFTPLAFLPLRRWYIWLGLIPGALLTLLVTNYDPPVQFSFHYVMHWAPYLFMGTVLALVAIGKSPDLGPVRARAALLTMCSASIVLSFNYGAFAARENSFKGGFHKVEFTYTETEDERYKRLMDLVKDIPKDATVAATEKVGPHLSSRRILHTMRTGPHGATWIVASSRELKLSKTKPSLRAVLDRNEYGVIKRSGDFALFKKGAPTDGNAKLIREWGL